VTAPAPARAGTLWTISRSFLAVLTAKWTGARATSGIRMTSI